MSRSRTRKSAKKNSNYSEEYLVGYVLDGESIEMIMKKFETMEQIQKEKTKTSAPVEGKSEIQSDVVAPSLSAEDYKEIFKQTSSFTKAMVSKGEVSVLESFDAWNYEESDFFNAVQDYIVSEDEMEVLGDHEFWDDGDYEDDFGKKRKGLPGGRQARREIFEITGEDGFVYAVKRKAKVIDPLEPQLVKIPPEPVPLSWARTIKPFDEEEVVVDDSCYYEADVLSFDFKKLKNKDFQAILVDPPWQTEGNTDSRRIVPEDLKKINWNTLIPNLGFLFMWIEKEHIHQTVRILEKLGFVYAENFVWVKQAVHNGLHADPSKYFLKSKVSLLIFKKGNGKLELRHQRNPDVVFDFVKHDKELTEDKPEFVYHVIETLLPTANYSEASPKPKLIELWAKKGTHRKGWVTIAQK